VVNVARWFRWVPIAFGRKSELTVVERLRRVKEHTVPVSEPKRTQEANKQKLKMYPRIRVVRKRA
jgi:hypothetical protein